MAFWEGEKGNWVYSIWCEFGDALYVKVGFSTNFPARFSVISATLPERPIATNRFQCQTISLAKAFERKALARLRMYRTKGEWFCSAGSSGLDLGREWEDFVLDVAEWHEAKGLRFVRMHEGENVLPLQRIAAWREQRRARKNHAILCVNCRGIGVIYHCSKPSHRIWTEPCTSCNYETFQEKGSKLLA